MTKLDFQDNFDFSENDFQIKYYILREKHLGLDIF